LCVEKHMATRDHTLYKMEEGIFWFTTSIVEHKNVFVTKEYFDVIINSFKYFEKEKKVRTVLYCIIPNHLHWSFKLPSGTNDPINVYRNFKRHTAVNILDNLKNESKCGMYKMLKLFNNNTSCARHLPENLLQIFECKAINKKQNYAVWQEKPDLKIIVNEDFFLEKLNYCHRNPLQYKWQLVDDPADYPYSSCRFYEYGEEWNGLNIYNPLGC